MNTLPSLLPPFPNHNESIHYLNLSNGIGFFPDLPPGVQPRFIRIQSSVCEAKNFNRVIEGIDYGFLLDLALGRSVIVYDCTSNGNSCPRALWQGLGFIQYCCEMVWFGTPSRKYLSQKGVGVNKYFDIQYRGMGGANRNKIKYFRKFLNTDKLSIQIVFRHTQNDGNYEKLKNILIAVNQ